MGHQIPSEGENAMSQKDLVNICFISLKCVWKPEPKVSKPNKHIGKPIRVWLQFNDISEDHKFYPNTFDEFR